MYKYSCFVLFVLCMASCVKITDKFEQVEFVNYKYPYETENNDINCEIIVYLKEDVVVYF